MFGGGKVSIARDPSVTGERIVGCAEWPLTGGKWSGTASVLARLYVETGIFCFQAAHEPGWMQICFCAFWLFGQELLECLEILSKQKPRNE